VIPPTFVVEDELNPPLVIPAGRFELTTVRIFFGYYGFCHQLSLFVVWTLSSPLYAVRAVKSLHVLNFFSFARRCHFKGFTEFDAIHNRSFLSMCSN